MRAARLRRALRRSPRYLAGRVLDAAKRRSRRPWSRLYPRLLTARTLAASLGVRSIDEAWDLLARQPFFIASGDRAGTAARFKTAYPQVSVDIAAAADKVLRHEFDLLGSGPRQLGARLPWHTDFKTGREWPRTYCTDIEYNELDRPTDVKVPWELSRCQHFTRLGQAYWLTCDERYADEFVAEISDWIAANPLSYGVNWACAMDVALRAVSWIWGFHFFAGSKACRDAGFRGPFLRTLFLHGEFIVKHLEKADLNGNHYLCDGVGLVFLGCFFAHNRRARRRWLPLGRSIVEQEIFNQTTADGVDFEQSTAYHRLVLEAFLTSYELLRRSGVDVPGRCRERLERMCEFVQAYTKPGGCAPLIGDADDGRVQVLGLQPIRDHRYLLSSAALLFDRSDFKAASGRCWEETFWIVGSDAPVRFAALPDHDASPRSMAFADGGFFVLRGATSHLVVDCGDVGMKGRGGHGHNDILSFELSLNGIDVVTDCGAYLYTASRDWRNQFRSTAFHNTVQVDGEELNRFLAPDALWQLQYDARPTEATMRCCDGVDSFRGGHAGYARLASPVIHTRSCFVDRHRPRVLILDQLTGEGDHFLIWRLHLDPSITPRREGRDICLSAAGGVVWLMTDDTLAGLALSVEAGWVSPSYGVKVPTAVLTWSGRARTPIDATYLFSDVQMTLEERAAAVEATRTRAAC